MVQSQDIWYTLAPSKRQSAATHVRARRLLFIFVILLLALAAIFFSVDTLLTGRHTWGLHAQQLSIPGGAWQVTWVGNGLAEGQIQSGDHILLADGHPPSSEDAINQASSLQVLPIGQTRPHTVGWDAPSQLDTLLSLSWIILGGASLLLGLLVFLHATERSLALRFFLLWATLAFVGFLEPASPFGNLLAIQLVSVLSVGLFFGLLTSFLWLLLFPASSSSLATTRRPAGHRWLPEIPVLTGIIICILYLAAVSLQQQDFFTLANALGDIQAILGICLSLIFMLRAGLSRRATIVRERARALLGGMLFGLTPLLVVTVVPTVLTGLPLVPGQISALVLVALPLSFAYAVVRRDLLRVDSLIRNTVLALLTIIGIAIAAVFLAELLNPLPAIPALVLSVIAGALLAPLMLNAARWITEAWLFPQVRRYRKLIASGESIERSGLNPERLAGLLVGEVHLALPVRQVAVFVPDKQSGQLVALLGKPAGAIPEERASLPTVTKISSPLQAAPEQQPQYPPLLLDDTVTARLSRTAAPIAIAPVLETPTEDATDSAQGSKPSDVDTERWRLLIPMRVHGRFVGVLALTHREDEQDYSGTDRQMLRFLAGRRALALDYSLLYADLHAAYEQRRELDAAKDRFIVTAHHELRTPLTGVLGYLELLRELGPEGRVARPKDVDIFLNNACRSAEELTAQLESMLTAAEASFTPHQIDLRPVQIGAVVQHAMHTLEGQARAGSHRVLSRIPEEMMALADEGALYRVLLNLLSNSLKYSAEGRPVIFDTELPSEVSDGQIVWASPPAKHYSVVNVVVRDWGNGIPHKQQPMIFERFMRLDHDLNSPIRGTGLGLSICYQLTVSMGGGLGVWSEGITGKGSLFVVQLSGVETAQEPTARSFGDTHI